MSIVKQTIIAELQDLVTKSKHYAHELETSKTDVKRKMMKKRLKRNNEKVANLIVALERINKKEKKDVEDGAEGRAETKSSAEEFIN